MSDTIPPTPKYIMLTPGKLYTSYMNYRQIDSGGRVVDDQTGRACYSSITYGHLHENAETIEFYHATPNVPYAEKEVRRWVEAITAIGFPCALKSYDENWVVISIKIADYEHKPHFTSAMMLVRCLFEAGIFYVADAFFQLCDNEPDADRFKLMQIAHLVVGEVWKIYYNCNHTITSNRGATGRECISKEEFFARVKAINHPVKSGKVAGITALWSPKQPLLIPNENA